MQRNIVRASIVGLILMGGLATLRAQSEFCSLDALRHALPDGMTIEPLKTFSGAVKPKDGVSLLPATAQRSAMCLITGKVTTNESTQKTAGFAALLPEPDRWNKKFMFTGCGGNCGTVSMGGGEIALAERGYAVWKTDDGHDAADPNWPIVSPGTPNQDTIADFAYRAVHTTTVKGKEFVEKYYTIKKVAYSYFDGCSDGGREGMVAASRYPNDFDGLLLGAPYFDVAGQNLTAALLTVQLRFPDGNLDGDKFKLASEIAMNKCDALDGTKDNLIQNPALCDFDPKKDLPRCSTEERADCFTDHQIESLSAILSAITDPNGGVIHPGYSVSNMSDGRGNLMMWTGIASQPEHPESASPWSMPSFAMAGTPGRSGSPARAAAPRRVPFSMPSANAMLNLPGLSMWAYAGKPGVDPLHGLGFSFAEGRQGPVRQFHVIVPVETTKHIYEAMNIASGDFPNEMDAALAKDRKIVLYHGLSDGLITPFRTIQYFEELAAKHGGYEKLGRNMRFFVVPGMEHCGGGAGPNDFGQDGNATLRDPLHDAVTALEIWVEKGSAPEMFIATHHAANAASPLASVQNVSTSTAGNRTMPLCPFPIEAHYKGTGDINAAENWTCPAGDKGMLKSGYDGQQAGITAPLFTGTEDHTRQGAPTGSGAK